MAVPMYHLEDSLAVLYFPPENKYSQFTVLRAICTQFTVPQAIHTQSFEGYGKSRISLVTEFSSLLLLAK